MSTQIYDTGVQEITPQGTPAWTWWASEHIADSEVPASWCEARSFTGEYDPYHINSAAPDGNGVIMSFRHLDAVYRVSKATGSVTWKLGGNPRPESLTVLNDPVAATGDTFRGNHDARVLSDGTVTVHDNGCHPTAAAAAAGSSLRDRHRCADCHAHGAEERAWLHHNPLVLRQCPQTSGWKTG